jgi:hypothetical protein
VAYQLRLPNAWKIHDMFHASLLTPYRETLQHGPNYIKPPPELIEGEHEYEVEAIVNHRLYGKRKTLQYLFKWKGYPDADNTWEPAPQVHRLLCLHRGPLHPRPGNPLSDDRFQWNPSSC